jgi:Homeodomain-like domain
MNTWLLWLCRTIVLVLCERVHLALTTMALRHQLAVLQRSATRPQYSPVDRCVWVLLSMVWARWREALTIVQPDTVRRWRRQGLRHHLRRWRGRKRPGRPAIAAEMRALIRRMSRENVLWGAPRIQGELATLGVRVSRTTVARYMARRLGPPSPTWRTFLRHHAYDFVPGGASAELARRLHALAVQAIRALRWWLASWTTSEAQRSARRDVASLTPLSSTTSVSSLWAPGIVDRVRVPERSPPNPQRPGHHDPVRVDVPRAIETAHMRLAAEAAGHLKVSFFKRQQVPCDTTGQAGDA